MTDYSCKYYKKRGCTFSFTKVDPCYGCGYAYVTKHKKDEEIRNEQKRRTENTGPR